MQNLLLQQMMGIDFTEDLQEVKSQQASLFASEASRIIVQSRVYTVEQDETRSRFFFQKVHKESSALSSLKEVNGLGASMKGVTIPSSGGWHVKASLYMDDVAVFCSDPLSVCRLMSNQFELALGAKGRLPDGAGNMVPRGWGRRKNMGGAYRQKEAET
eukprot:g28774.t1